MNKKELAEQIILERKLQNLQNESKIWKTKYDIVSKELKASDKRANFLADISRPPRQRDLYKIKDSGEATAIFVLSDWHAEETVDPATINGLNEHSLKSCKTKVENCFSRFLIMTDMIRSLTKIDNLVVAALGDFITGYIHEELEENNSLSPTEAVLFVSDLLVNGIRFLKREGKFKSIIVPTCVGNHGRTGKQKRIASAYANSYEWLMYKTLEKYVQEPGVTWKVENSYHNWLNIQGFDVRFHHGDYISYGGGVGGISIAVNKAIAQWNKVQVADFDYFGHFHQFMNSNRCCCNSSVIGYNAYALSIKAEFEVPSQTISVISKNRGKILTDRVFCD